MSAYRETEKTVLMPTADNVAVKRFKGKEKTDGGLYIPELAQKKSMQCEVVAVGPGKFLDNGERAPMSVKKGDIVFLAEWRGHEVNHDGEDLAIVKEDEILAVLEA